VLTVTEWAAIADTPGEELTRPGTAAPLSEQRGLFDDEGPSRDGRGAVEAEAGSASGAAAQVSVVDARGPERPGGSRFGELVHAVLAAVPLEADRAAIDALTEVHGRIVSAPADELIAAAQTVQRVLAHDLLARARSASRRGACRRETPVTCLLGDGVMVEGIVDLAFEEQGAWTVVDYKTDRELAAVGEDRYRRQVALYASAIAQATGQQARGVLVRV
jgi:ATP-dependent exoDNAse (exonuclease V) beta subunit